MNERIASEDPGDNFKVGDFVTDGRACNPEHPEHPICRTSIQHGHGLTDRGWILGHAQAPDGALVRIGTVHKGWKLTSNGWRPASGLENLLNHTWFIVG